MRSIVQNNSPGCAFFLICSYVISVIKYCITRHERTILQNNMCDQTLRDKSVKILEKFFHSLFVFCTDYFR